MADLSNRKIILIFLLLSFILFDCSSFYAQLQLNGSASKTSCKCYELTPDATFLASSIWYKNKISLQKSFDYKFKVFLGCKDSMGVDGMTFSLQNIGAGVVGANGGNFAMGGISPSLVVEIDTYQNTWDPSDYNLDHIAIMQDGSPDHNTPDNLAGPVQASATAKNIEDCTYHDFEVDWNAGTKTMKVYFDGSLRLPYSADIVNTIFSGNPNVYWGITAGTGLWSNEQKVCFYNYGSLAYTSDCISNDVSFSDSSFITTGKAKSWSWNFGDGQNSSLENPSHTYSGVGTYTVQLITSDSLGCADTTYSAIVVSSIASIDAGADATILKGETIQLNGTGGGVYSWSPSSSLSCTNCPNPIANPTVTTTYYIKVSNSNGCIYNDSVKIVVNLCGEMFIPNVFSPNGDGKNDLFTILASCVSDYKLAIYNRWGEQIFQATSPNNYWDGNITSGGGVPDGIYYYILKISDVKGENSIKNGTVTLVR